MNQRWLFGRDSYRPPSEVIRTAEYDVASIGGDTEPKAFVLTHHYSRSYPAARFRFGLYRGGALVGVAVFSHPSNDKVLTNTFPCAATEAVELGRFVLLDSVPGNGESWFLARCFESLRAQRLFGVLSFSDPMPRTAADGTRIFPGHIGYCYQATNATYLGKGTPRTLQLLPDGSVFSARTAQKIRARERGWQHAAEQLRVFGASELREDEDASGWLRTWTTRLTRPLRHRGNHKYAWTLARANRSVLPTSLPYPKRAA